MISICIPIYNYKMRPLVEALHEQAVALGVQFEILLIDDASDEEFRKENRKLTGISRYIELAENIGRAKIRKMLAKEAQYENLLFLDCDMEVSSSLSLKKYVDIIVIGKYAVVSGGHIYAKQPPTADFYLHWHYGVEKETKSNRFMSSNFLAKKAIVDKIPFNETIQGYGYEDFLFEMELKRQNVVVKHINNPFIHNGLDCNLKFIKKTENSTSNLLQLWQQKLIFPAEVKYARLLNVFCKIDALKMTALFNNIYNSCGKKIRKILIQKPNLFLLDLYKLLYICHIQSKQI